MVIETEAVADIPLEIATVVRRMDVDTREVVVTVDSADEAKRAGRWWRMRISTLRRCTPSRH